MQNCIERFSQEFEQQQQQQKQEQPEYLHTYTSKRAVDRLKWTRNNSV